MAKELSKKDLLDMIKEAVTKKIKLLKEDIDMDDDEIWDFYNDDESGDWFNSQGKMPNGYDNDITDGETIDRLSRMNSNLPVDMVGSPALKKAEMDASWAASDREDKANAERLNGEYEDNFYDDSNINSDPNSSDGSGITDATGVSASSDEMWSANESKVYKSIKKIMESKIRKDPTAFGFKK